MDKILADAVLFDLDGTLVDSFALSTRWWQEWVGRVGLDWDSISRRVRGRHAINVLRELLPDRPAALNEADAASLGRWEETNVHLMRAMPGAADLLSTLRSDRWAVVTTSDRGQATARLRAAGLPLPDVLVTSDDVRNLKPHPEGYLLACAALGTTAADCVVVEDSVTGVAAGRSSGATVLAVGHEATDGSGDSDEGVIRLPGLHDIRVLDSDSGVTLRVSPAARRRPAPGTPGSRPTRTS